MLSTHGQVSLSWAPPRVLTPREAVLQRCRHRHELPPLGSSLCSSAQSQAKRRSRRAPHASTSGQLWAQLRLSSSGARTSAERWELAREQPLELGSPLSAPALAVTEQQTSEAAQTHPKVCFLFQGNKTFRAASPQSAGSAPSLPVLCAAGKHKEHFLSPGSQKGIKSSARRPQFHSDLNASCYQILS